MRPIVLLCLLALAGFATASASAAPPTATTGQGSGSGPTTAHVDGLVERNGEDTQYYFEYGTTTAYGQKTAEGTLGADAPLGGCAGCHPVSADITGLQAGTTYHFRLVADNASGPASEGADKTFTTHAAQQTAPADSDGDGIADAQDACPGAPGPSASGGCPPPPDADGDGFADSADACPAQPGPPAGPGNAQGCPPPPPPMGPSAPQDDPNDVDGDGVANALDKCAHTWRDEKPLDARGCGPFSARAIFGARDTKEIRDAGVHVQCENGAGSHCTFRLAVTLSKASARRLGVARRIVGLTLTTSKSTFAGRYVYAMRSAPLSSRVEKAFKRAHAKRIPVTMTFSGTYAVGSGKAVALPKSTFTMKQKPPGGSAYRVEPSISHGDAGSQATGLTRPKDDGDF